VPASGGSASRRARLFEPHLRLAPTPCPAPGALAASLECALRAGRPPVLDGVHATRAERAGPIAAARAAGFRVSGRRFEPRLAPAIVRDADLRAAAAAPELPDPAEGFDAPWAVTLVPGGFDVRPWRAGA
jgi:hypothetical protein